MCVGISSEPLPLRSCAPVTDAARRKFLDGGGLLTLLTENASGFVIVAARLRRGVYAVTEPDALEAAMMDELRSDRTTTVTRDAAKSTTIPMPDGSTVLKTTLDADDGSHTHGVALSVPGRKGLYSFLWTGSHERSHEMDSAADRALATIVHDDGKPALGTTVEAVVASEQSAVLACYRAGLATAPMMAGKITVRLTIRANGTVAAARKMGGSGLRPNVEECVLAQYRPIRFPLPGPDGAEFSVPLIFQALRSADDAPTY